MSRIGITLQGEDTDPLALPAPDEAAYAGQWAAAHGEYRIAQQFMGLAAALEAYEEERAAPVSVRCSACGHIGTPYVAVYESEQRGAPADAGHHLETGLSAALEAYESEQRGAPVDAVQDLSGCGCEHLPRDAHGEVIAHRPGCEGRGHATKRLDGSHAPQRCGVNGCGAIIRYDAPEYDVSGLDVEPGTRTVTGPGSWVHVEAPREPYDGHNAVPAPH